MTATIFCFQNDCFFLLLLAFCSSPFYSVSFPFSSSFFPFTFIFICIAISIFASFIWYLFIILLFCPSLALHFYYHSFQPILFPLISPILSLLQFPFPFFNYISLPPPISSNTLSNPSLPPQPFPPRPSSPSTLFPLNPFPFNLPCSFPSVSSLPPPAIISHVDMALSRSGRQTRGEHVGSQDYGCHEGL